MSKRKRARGNNDLFLIGGVIGLLFLFSSRKSSGVGQTHTTTSIGSTMKSLIRTTLSKAGYSERQAYNWFLVSNMETAGFTSRLFMDQNNAFGMKQPVKRETTSIGPGPSGFATYGDAGSGVDDLVLYLQEFNYQKDFSTLDDQLIFMKSKGYFANESLDSYRNKVVAWANKFGYPIMQLAA